MLARSRRTFAAGEFVTEARSRPMKWTEIGFDRDHLAYASVSPSRAGYSAERIGPYVDRVREELARLPGVVGVVPLGKLLLSDGGTHGSLNVPGRSYVQGIGAHMNWVGEGFFETLGIPLLAAVSSFYRPHQPGGTAHFAIRTSIEN